MTIDELQGVVDTISEYCNNMDVPSVIDRLSAIHGFSKDIARYYFCLYLSAPTGSVAWMYEHQDPHLV